MRRLAALVASACVATVLVPAVAVASPSKPPPMLTVSGRVLAPDGRPAPGVHVDLVEPVSLFDVFLAVTCIFAILPALAAPDVCFPGYTEAITDRAGRYTLRFAKDSRLGRESEHFVDVTGVRPAGTLAAPTLTARYPFRGASRALPDLQLWHGNLSVTDGAPGRTKLHADPIPARYEKPTTPYAELRTNRGTGLFGRSTAFAVGPFAGDREIDSRLLEHGTERFWAGASGRLGDVRVGLVAAPVAVRHTGAPLSRGRGCWTYGTKDVVLPYRGCRFTDGRLPDEPGFHYAIADGKACRWDVHCENPALIVVDLGEVKLVDFVALRGCACPFEASADGVRWVAPPALERTGSGDDLAVSVVPVPARYVRVSYADTFVWDVREISVFGRPLPVSPPAPAAPAAPPAPRVPAVENPVPPRTVTNLVTLPDHISGTPLPLP